MVIEEEVENSTQFFVKTDFVQGKMFALSRVGGGGSIVLDVKFLLMKKSIYATVQKLQTSLHADRHVCHSRMRKLVFLE